MKKRLAVLALGFSAIALVGAAPAGPQRPWLNPSLSPDRRADLAAAAMTRDEKLKLVFGYFASSRPEKNYTAPAESREGSAGYVPGIPRLGIPAQWETDAGVGVATQGAAKQKRERTALPAGIATTATWNPATAFRGGAMIGDEARRSGFNVMLAGGVDLMREPRNGRNFEYGGEDPLLAGTMVGAQVRGIQSNDIISTIKHYALNDQETDRDTGNSIVDPATARMSDLLGFEIAVEHADPGAIMCSYNHVNGTYACENKWLLTDVLRRDWGWKGYVMSDWGATHSTVAAANAGLEQDSGYPFDKQPFFGAPLKEAVAHGEVSEARLNEMARRILRSMFAHGLVDRPVTAGQPIDFAAHAAITRADASEAVVLLKNANGILPLSPNVRRIAIIGGHADKGVLAGGGSSLVYPRGGNAVPGVEPAHWPGPVMYYPSSPMAEIKRQAPNATIRFASGDDPAEAAALARDSDVVIVFATQWEGESFDVPLTLPDRQDLLIDLVAAANPKTVVVLETGGPVLTPWVDKVGGLLEAWFPGTEGGAAIADLLFGRVNPSGHLPATFPRDAEQLPHPGAPHPGDTTYTEGAAIGYKWFDARGFEPQFAFGYGLSYTDFGISGLRAAPAGPSIAATFTIRNTGRRAGAAVPQIYVGGAGWEAPKRLGGWEKVSLAPGASRIVTVNVDPRLLATWDEGTHSWRIAPGTYQVMLGASARDIRQTVTVHLAGGTLPGGWHPARP
ncbi:MAG TPA: glycoside hydrolase family 3 C-terminal domain-containing protein [Allosphingosinicella sp.]|jgi:beta-glucosidase|nr:glycoside hydrolase family 3 C-terminal domain-containing protein [Allosphingosinicella sp.]